MSQTQGVVLVTGWQEWDGRIVGGKYPLRAFLGGSDEHVDYLTEFQGKPAVIKMLPSGAPQAAAQVAAWKLAARLSHPNLVRVLDTGLWHADDEQDMQFAVLEYCDESLAEVLRHRALTPDEARAMLLSTLEALQYLHAQGIAHGCVDPEHIRAAGDQLKLAIGSLRQNGDPNYSRGNECTQEGSGTASFSGDIRSLGVTLLQALTCRAPAHGKHGAPELSEKLPAPFDAIVSGCLQSDPRQRLSIGAIRNLLDAPASPVEAPLKRIAEIAAPARSADTPILLKGVQTSITDEPTPAPASAWRVLAVPAAAVFVVLAILVGLHFARIPDKPASGPAVRPSQPAALSAAATTASPATHNAIPAATRGTVQHQVMPEISTKARDTINGAVKVKVRVQVNSQGRVMQAKLAAHGPSAYFAKRAVEAARQWSFVAPVQNGEAQSSDWILHFEFRRSGTRVSAEEASRG